MKFQFPLSTMEAYMKRAGITSAYMKKPCLDPTDPECPDSAPNKKSGQVSCMLNYVVAVFSNFQTDARAEFQVVKWCMNKSLPLSASE